MTDDLDKLKQAMGTATPAPDPAKRAANLRLAEENFDRLQGSAAEARPTPKRAPMARLFEGVGKMLNTWTTKGALVGSTAVAALAMVWIGSDIGNFTSGTDVSFEIGARVTEQPAEDPQSKMVSENREAFELSESIGAPVAPAPAAAPSPEPAQSSRVQRGESTGLVAEMGIVEAEEATDLGPAVTGDFGTITMGDTDGSFDFEQDALIAHETLGETRLRYAPADAPVVTQPNTETFD